jgi:hypothetical protein
MNLLKKLQAALPLIAVFSAIFITLLLTILFTQAANSTPSQYVFEHNGMEIKLGPPPNSTDIPLDTTITIDALATATITGFHVTPEVPMTRSHSETTGPLNYLYTYYPAQPLKPATTYTVSATISDAFVLWSFATTAEPFKPSLSYLLATNALWIALATATSATAIVVLAMRWRKASQNEP